MLTIHVWPKRLKEFLLTHPLYKSPPLPKNQVDDPNVTLIDNRSAGFSSTGFALYLRQQKRPL